MKGLSEHWRFTFAPLLPSLVIHRFACFSLLFGGSNHLIPSSFFIWLRLFCVVLFLGQGVFTAVGAANKTLDSLEQVLPETEGLARLKVYNQLVQRILNSDPQKALEYAQESHLLALELKNEKWIAGTLLNSASIYDVLGRQTEALVSLQRVKAIFERNNDSLSLSICLGNIANVYSSLSDRQSAIKYARKAYEISQDIRDSVGIAVYAQSLAAAYSATGVPDSAILYYSEALEQMLTLDMRLERGVTLGNLGGLFLEYELMPEAIECFQEALQIGKEKNHVLGMANACRYLGRAYFKLDQLDSAHHYYRQSLAVLEQNDILPGQGIAHLGLANVFLAQKQPGEALKFMRKALLLIEQGANVENLAKAYDFLGDVFLDLGNSDSAQVYWEKAIHLCQRHQLIKVECNVVEKLATYYQEQGQTAEAAGYAARHEVLIDSIYRETSYAALEKIRADYHAKQTQYLQQRIKLEKQRVELQQARTEGQRWLLLTLVLGLGLLLALLLGMRYRSQTQWRGRLLEEREKGIRSLMEAENKVREEVSRDLHDGLGQLLTSVRMQLYGWKSNTGLENGVVSAKEMAKVDQLIGEALGQVRDAAHLMMPRMLEEAGLAAALNELLKYSIDPRQLTWELDAIHTEKRLDRNLEFNLYRVCQELVSNTLKHAQASHFSVQLVYFPKQVQLALEDNGKGFDYASAIGKGAGLNNVKNRVELLGGVLVVEPTLPQGQITKIRIPLNG